MDSNASLKEIGRTLEKASRIIIFPHVNPDGDALGSAAALCFAMRKAGKEAWVLMEEPVPEYLSFMDTEYFTEDLSRARGRYVSVCVDCGEEKRFPERAESFRRGETTICIDHHSTSGKCGDLYYIDEDEAATAQIIYELLKEMGIPLDRREAEALYVGICTDTGSFKYSNTTARTHRIAAELFERNIDHNSISVALYQSVDEKRLRLRGRILETMELFSEGRGAVACLTDEALKELSASPDDGEGAVEMLRDIKGVELAAFLKEKEEGVRVSMRAKSRGGVSEIASKFGGGGHAKAAGCTLQMHMEEARAVIIKEMEDYLEKSR